LIYNNLGMVYGKQARYNEALNMFKSALESGLRLAPIYRNIGQVYLTRKEYDQAAEAYAQAISQRPTLEVAYRDMLKDALVEIDDPALMSAAQRQLTDGLSEADRERYDPIIIMRYAERDPKLADDYLNYAQALFKGGDSKEGIDACHKAIELQPQNSAAHTRLGVMLASPGNLTGAEDEFTKAVELDAKNDEARENLERCKKKLG